MRVCQWEEGTGAGLLSRRAGVTFLISLCIVPFLNVVPKDSLTINPLRGLQSDDLPFKTTAVKNILGQPNVNELDRRHRVFRAGLSNLPR